MSIQRVALSGGLSYVGPGGVSINQTISAQATYTAMESGTVDIPTGQASGSAIALSFGSVAQAKAFFISSPNVSVKLALNGATGAPISCGSGCQGVLLSPVVETAAPITSAVIVTVAQQSGLGQVDYIVFGD